MAGVPRARRGAAAQLLGIEAAKVRVHMIHAGGSSERTGATDVITQAVVVAKAVFAAVGDRVRTLPLGKAIP
jgi:CO/xanthine dehydrogenase Mo-binding subunit